MPHLTTDDAVRLYCEEIGAGTPIVFVHEFADDYRGYEGQLRCFGRRYRGDRLQRPRLSALGRPGRG